MEHTSDGTLHATYFTFAPRPLMEGNFYSMTDGLAGSLTDAHRALGFLDGMVSVVTDRKSLSDLILFRESCFSKMLDCHDFNILSMFVKHGKGDPNNDIQNIVSAYRYAINTTPKKLSYTSIANHALHGNDPNRKISIRTKPLFLTKSSSSYRQYNPTAPEKIQSALYDISTYIESNNTDAFIKAAMCHYQFEMIHPYECYNGIVGRILPHYIINNTSLNGTILFSLSASLYRHKAEYLDKLWSTQKNGNYTAWIDFFIHIIREATQHSIEFIQYYNALATSDEEKILARNQNRTDHTLDVYKHFKRNIVSSIGYASETLRLSFSAVSRSVTILQDMGILIQITGIIRKRVFAHAGLLEQLALPD